MAVQGSGRVFTSLLSNYGTKKPQMHHQPKVSLDRALANNSAFVQAHQANACRG